MSQRGNLQKLYPLLEGELNASKLEKLSREFDSLAQDTSYTLEFFVLQCACMRLAAVLEGEAVTPHRFHELTDGIARDISRIVSQIDQGQQVSRTDLESLIGRLFRNIGLFGS